MDNIKTHNIDGNRLIEDLENNKYWIIFKNYLGEEITSEIPKDIFDAYIESKSAYKKNKNEEERHWDILNYLKMNYLENQANTKIV